MRKQVNTAYDELTKVRHQRDVITSQIEEVSQTIVAIKDAQGEYGELQTEKAKDVLALYGALLTINKRMGVDIQQSASNAGYIVYAFLGGQARREIYSGSFINEKSSDYATKLDDGWKPSQSNYKTDIPTF